jgi:CheY-like chemotaxis protein
LFARRSASVNQGRILVVDDDESILFMANELLQEFGYDAELARNSNEAVKLYQKAREAGHPFDLLIIDLSLPGGQGGKETLQRIKAIDPDAKAIVSSGYAEDPVVVNCREHGFVGAVSKPYLPEELATVVYGLIGHTKF